MTHDGSPDASRLADERKVALLSGHDEWRLEAVPELGLAPAMMTDGPHGLRKVGSGGLLDAVRSTPATCFPTAAALGSSWDRGLVREVGTAIGREARDQGVAVVLGPGVNIKRHPLCGRNFEYFSEDPLLAGELAAAWIEGSQSLGAGACLKHYAVNNQETHRMVVDVVVDDRTLREVYLPAFEIAVRQAQPWTVMSAYNRVGGTYCSQHPWLLDTVLRDEFGFEGLVVSDWGANDDRVAAVAAGLDLEMPGGASVHDAAVLAALHDGSLPRGDLDACVQRVVDLLARAAEAAATPLAGDLDPAAHHALARRAAAESSVLLENGSGLLPVDPGVHVAVIGDFAVHPRYQGSGSSRVTPSRLDVPLDEIRGLAAAAGGKVTYSRGYDEDSADRADLVEAAVAAARDADVAVVFAGLPGAWESEGFDRQHMRLPDQHNRLVAAVAAANPDTVVVLAGGAPVEIPWVDTVAAVLCCYLGGQAVGGAVADVLYGVGEPGGRLAETFPRRREDIASDQWFPGSARQVQYREGLYVGYRFFETADADVLFPFGHGLSYTRFELDAAELSADAFDADGAAGLAVSVEVANVGERAGSEVVQIYVRPVDSPVHRPALELRGFDKVHLAAGERTTVTCTLDRRAFAHWDTKSDGWQVCPGRYEVLVATSARNVHAVLPVEVRSSFAAATGAATRRYGRFTENGFVVDDEEFSTLLGRPIPAEEPPRPFHRNSTIGDLGATPLGRPVLAALRGIVGLLLRRADTDGGLRVMIDRALPELPLRNLASMTGGHISLRAVDHLVAFANALAPRSAPTPGAGLDDKSAT